MQTRTSSSVFPFLPTLRHEQTQTKGFAFQKRRQLLTAFLVVGSLAGLGLWRFRIRSRLQPLIENDRRSKLDQLAFDTDRPPLRLRMQAFVKDLQQRIVDDIQSLEPRARFTIDSWSRPEGGSGISCVLQDGEVIEKAGVGVSIVHGLLPPAAIQQMTSNHKHIPWDPKSNVSLPFTVQGISLIVHPVNPFAPTVHLNYRYFELYAPGVDPLHPKSSLPIAAWFGGGTDLTPTYLNEKDAVQFHGALREALNKTHPSLYSLWKKWCDEYFYLPHRKESRGLGGIFFDDISPQSVNFETDWENLFDMVRNCGEAFFKTYMPILRARHQTPYSEREKHWQQLRRGRYVEFNLVHDRGTKFGLATPGVRIESVLMSLPLHARWEYMAPMGQDSHSAEGKLLAALKTPRDWV